jgi:DNA modification methylase
MTTTKKITWKTERRKVKDLIPADYNPRKITERQKQELVDSIKEFSEVDPLVINTNNHVIGGHQRLSIYVEQAIDEIDVRVPDRKLTIDEEVKLNLRLNKNTGEWDPDKLQEMDIETLLDVGFGDEELSTMFDNVDIADDHFNTGKAIEEAKTTTVKLGEIYELGVHRLMCGDSTKEEDVAKLMGKEKSSMIYCDPPYNIGLSYTEAYSRTEGMREKYGGTYDDKDKNDIQYAEFISSTIENIKKFAEENAHYFYWCDEKYIGLIQSIYEKLKISNKRVCLWIKNGSNPVPCIAFNKVYEACIYGTMGKPFLNKNYTAFNEVLNKEVEGGNQMHDDIFDLFNIWLIRRDTRQDYEHPTQKPLSLHEKPLKRCSGPGTIVVDLFGGSGSTLMSCDQLNRRCFTIEQDPIFCQVIINRWENHKGEKAKKLN